MDLLVGGFELILLFAVLAWFLFWVIAVISIIRNEFPGTHDKLIWIVLVVFVPFIGTILYFAIGRSKRIKHNY